MEVELGALFLEQSLPFWNPSSKLVLILWLYIPLLHFYLSLILHGLFLTETWWRTCKDCRLFWFDCRNEHRWPRDGNAYSSWQRQQTTLCSKTNQWLLLRKLTQDISPKPVRYSIYNFTKNNIKRIEITFFLRLITGLAYSVQQLICFVYPPGQSTMASIFTPRFNNCWATWHWTKP